MAFSGAFLPAFARFLGGIAGLLLRDLFDGTGSLDAHAPDINVSGQPWVELSGSNWSISGGAATNSVSTAGNKLATVDVGDPDVDVTVILTTAATVRAACMAVVRASSNTAFFGAQIEDTTDVFRIVENLTTRASASIAVNLGTTYTIRVVTAGNLISATLNGGSSINYSSSNNNTVGKHGFGEYRDGVYSTANSILSIEVSG